MDGFDSDSVSVAVIEAIAASEGVHPTDLDITLHDYVDPDALDALVDGADIGFHLLVQVEDHTVAVDSDGTITVNEEEVRNLA